MKLLLSLPPSPPPHLPLVGEVCAFYVAHPSLLLVYQGKCFWSLFIISILQYIHELHYCADTLHAEPLTPIHVGCKIKSAFGERKGDGEEIARRRERKEMKGGKRGRGREGDGKGEREMGETYSLNQSSSTCT